jgi:hypothetical protein
MPAAVWSVLSSLVTSSVLFAIAWWLFRTWAGARIRGEVDTQYAKEIEARKAELRAQTDTALERFRAQLEQDRALRTTATAAFAEAHSAAAERRLLAVQEVWDAAVANRNTAGRLMLVLDIFTREEIAMALDDPKIEAAVGNPTDKEITEMLKLSREAERVRPFIDEPLWAMSFGYQALLGRILVQLKLGREKGKIHFWLDDEYTRRLLASLVEPAELQRIERMRAGGIGEAIRSIEVRIVEAARKTVSGEAASDAAMKQATLILERAQRLEQA